MADCTSTVGRLYKPLPTLGGHKVRYPTQARLGSTRFGGVTPP